MNWVHVLAVHHHYHPKLGTQIAVWEESGQEREHGGKHLWWTLIPFLAVGSGPRAVRWKQSFHAGFW